MEKYKDVWTYCSMPDAALAARFAAALQAGPDARVEGLCGVEVDGVAIHTAMVFSVPKL